MNYPAASGRGIPLRKIPFYIAASGGEWNPKRKFKTRRFEHLKFEF